MAPSWSSTYSPYTQISHGVSRAKRTGCDYTIRSRDCTQSWAFILISLPLQLDEKSFNQAGTVSSTVGFPHPICNTFPSTSNSFEGPAECSAEWDVEPILSPSISQSWENYVDLPRWGRLQSQLKPILPSLIHTDQKGLMGIWNNYGTMVNEIKIVPNEIEQHMEDAP